MPGIEARIKELEKEASRPDVWEYPEKAAALNQEISELKGEVELWKKIRSEIGELIEFSKLSEVDADLQKEVSERYVVLLRQFKKEELRLFLGGKYDKNNAIISVYSGAGGRDAEDWAAMLFRMYGRYAEQKGFKAAVLHEHFGAEGGLKNATMLISGKYAYGYLKGEAGVHRLVRISPFSAQKLRHTSFALIEAMPEITESGEIEIKPEDLKIEFFRSSGPGGQNVNKRETAVRIIHLPTNIAAACQSERSQQGNRERALKLLYSKLHRRQIQETEKEKTALKGEKVAIEWGRQIRSYVLHPYKMVKDHRSGYETSQVDKVLEGELDELIEAELKLKT